MVLVWLGVGLAVDSLSGDIFFLESLERQLGRLQLVE